jgi:uncharacterized protein YjbI with pentapeptide repeats
MSEDAGTTTELIDLEARLLEQEHRMLRVFGNYLGRKQWTERDPRRRATITALLWWFFSPTKMAVASGGLIGAATLIFLFFQTQEMRRQSALLKISVDRENEYRLIEILAADGNTWSTSAKGKALLDLIELRRNAGADGAVDLSFAQLKGVSLTNVALTNVRFGVLDFTDARLEGCTFTDCSFTEIVSASNGYVVGTTFDNCFIHGLTLRNGSQLTDVTISSNRPSPEMTRLRLSLWSSGLTRVRFHNLYLVQFDASHSPTNPEDFELYRAGVTNCTFENCWFELRLNVVEISDSTFRDISFNKSARFVETRIKNSKVENTNAESTREKAFVQAVNLSMNVPGGVLLNDTSISNAPAP